MQNQKPMKYWNVGDSLEGSGDGVIPDFKVRTGLHES